MMLADGRMTLAEVARRYGVDEATVGRWLTRGVLAGGRRVRLRGVRVGRRWVVAAADLAEFLAETTAAAINAAGPEAPA